MALGCQLSKVTRKTELSVISLLYPELILHIEQDTEMCVQHSSVLGNTGEVNQGGNGPFLPSDSRMQLRVLHRPQQVTLPGYSFDAGSELVDTQCLGYSQKHPELGSVISLHCVSKNTSK